MPLIPRGVRLLAGLDVLPHGPVLGALDDPVEMTGIGLFDEKGKMAGVAHGRNIFWILASAAPAAAGMRCGRLPMAGGRWATVRVGAVAARASGVDGCGVFNFVSRKISDHSRMADGSDPDLLRAARARWQIAAARLARELNEPAGSPWREGCGDARAALQQARAALDELEAALQQGRARSAYQGAGYAQDADRTD